VRLAMLGLEKLGIEDPRVKNANVWSRSSNRSLALDAIAVVTGCVRKTRLKFRDWGRWPRLRRCKHRQAIRIAAKESPKRWRAHASEQSKTSADAGYLEMPEAIITEVVRSNFPRKIRL